MISLLIIVKHDRRIERLLFRLQEILLLDKVEIIVVDASGGTLDDIRDAFPQVQWLVYPPHGKKRTYAEQRNLAIMHAKGDVLVFIDADCLPVRDWLVHLTAPIMRGEEKIVSGSCRPMGKSFIHKEERYGRYREECETMNMALSRDVVDSVGLFDESLEGCEDSDFCIRARKKGFAIRFVQEAVIYHDWGGFGKNMLRSFYGGSDRARLYRKHRDHLFSLSINNIYTYYYLFYLLFLPVAFFYPLYLFVLFIPSLVKQRNPLKEFFNLSFSVGFLRQLLFL